MNRLEGKIAVVTGAGSGIGRAIAERFVAEGAHVYLAEIDPEAGKQAAAAMDGRARFVRTDVTDRASVRALAEAVRKEFEVLHVLVNNAGTNFFRDPLEADDATWQACIDLDMKGAWICVQALVPLMTEGGSILNIASTQPLRTLPGTFPYGAAKGGLLGMTAGWACDFGPRGIRVNAVLPGFIVTPLTYRTEKDPEAVFVRQVRAQTVKRLGTPEDVAWLAVYLASDESEFMSGAQIILDGGRNVLNAGVLPPDF
ncbi:MAG: 3-alpha-hydroxysteroid dehydrogenase [Fimbriimonadales bacterium]